MNITTHNYAYSTKKYSGLQISTMRLYYTTRLYIILHGIMSFVSICKIALLWHCEIKYSTNTKILGCNIQVRSGHLKAYLYITHKQLRPQDTFTKIVCLKTNISINTAFKFLICYFSHKLWYACMVNIFEDCWWKEWQLPTATEP